jgi:hypothetical protein
MGKKKSKAQVFVLKPWCWYCEREFEDEKGKQKLIAECPADQPSSAATSKVEALQVSAMSKKTQRG